MNGKRVVKVLGILSIVYAALHILFILLVFSSLYIFSNVFGGNSSWFLDLITQRNALLLEILVFSLIYFSLYILAGIGLVNYKDWARTLLIVLSIVGLLYFPIGTIVGIIFLIFLFNKDVSKTLN
ncbi:MAG: hypothetical protein Q7S27_04990 [Nanoarchaeota archaeon]|nr:hypothetical protein [Nanoarchaeota archaeon]